MKLKDFEIKIFPTKDDAYSFFMDQENADKWLRMYTSEIEAIPLEDNPLNLLVENAFSHTCADGYAIPSFEPDVSEEDIVSSMETTKMCIAISNGTKKVMYPLRYTAFGHVQDRAGISGRSINSLRDKSRAKEMSPKTRCKCLNYGLQLYKDSTYVLVRDGKVTAMLSGDANDYAVMPTTKLISILESELISTFSGLDFITGNTSHEITSLYYRILDSDLEENLSNMLQSYGMLIDNVIVSVRLSTSDVGLSAAKLTPLLSYDGKSFIPFGKPLGVEHKGGNKAIPMFEDITGRLLASFRDNLDNITRMMNVRINSPERCFKNVYGHLKLRGFTSELRKCCERIRAEHRHTCTAFDIYWYLNEMLFAYEQNHKHNSQLVNPFDMIKAQETITQVMFLDLTSFDE